MDNRIFLLHDLAAKQDEAGIRKLFADFPASKELLEVQDADGFTPFMISCVVGNGAIANLFLEQGSLTSYVTSSGNTALMYAAKGGSEACVQAVLRASPEAVNSVNRRGDTAIMFAAAAGHSKIVQMLIEAGADPAAINRDHVSAFHCASNAEVVEALAEGFNKPGASAELSLMINASNQDGKTPIFLAIQKGDVASVKSLLNLGADVSKHERSNKSALTLIGSSTNPEMEAIVKKAWAEREEQAKKAAAAFLESTELQAQPQSKSNNKQQSTKKASSAAKQTARNGPSKATQQQQKIVELGDDEEDDLMTEEKPSESSQKPVDAVVAPSVPAEPSDDPSGWKTVGTNIKTKPQHSQQQQPAKNKQQQQQRKPNQGKSQQTQQPAQPKHHQPKPAEVKWAAGPPKSTKPAVAAVAAAPAPASPSKIKRKLSSRSNDVEMSELNSTIEQLHPHAADLDLQPRFLLGLDLDSLSMEQLSALEDIHRKMLQVLEDARIELAKKQERERIEEEKNIELEIKNLQRKA